MEDAQLLDKQAPSRIPALPALPIVLVSGAVAAGDQITKHFVRESLFLGESWPKGWPVTFTHVENTGSAFGLFTNQTIFLIVASFIAMGFVVYMLRKSGSSPWLKVSLALMLGGGLSNLVDRLRFGSVTDFINFPVWPVFNVADSSVVIGIVILAYYALFLDRSVTNPPGP